MGARSNQVYSRSYAEDVTSVTAGASQGPHSFNLVFVCLCVCLFVSRLALSVSDGKKAWDVINVSILQFFFQAYPGIRTRTIALHAFPHTLRIHTHSSKLLHVIILRLKALFEFIYLFIYFTFPWPENIAQYGGRGAEASHGSKQKQSKNK